MGFHAKTMKTHNLSAYNYYQKYNLSQRNQQPNFQTLSVSPKSQTQNQVSFTGQRTMDFFIRKLHLNPLLHFEKFTKEEYSRLSQFEIQKLRDCSFNFIKSSHTDAINAFDDIHSIVPVILKDMFDKFFGAGEYVVITLGRSLSTVGKALGYRIGEDNVINMPMSFARRFLPDSTRVGDHFDVYRKINSRQEYMGRFLSCLDNMALSKEQVVNSGKNYVLMDYCSSGDSLKGAEFLFRSDNIWGSQANIYSVDILSALSKYDIPKMRLYSDRFDNPIQIDGLPILSKSFCANHLKPYSYVDRSIVLGETEAALEPKIPNYLRKERGWMTFRMLDNAMQPQMFETPKLKSCEDFSFSTQKVAPWHDYITQSEADIRNDIQRVNFQLLKLDAMTDCSEYRKLRANLNENHNNLTDYYNTYKSNPYSLLSYYESRGRILSCIEDAENVLKDRSIFAR